MDNDATKLLQEIHAEVKGARLFSVLLLLAIIGFSAMTMVMLQDLRQELRPAAAPPAVAAPAK
jgi:type II secretory pathway component PulK